jgi:hypothetical protein
MKSIKMKLSVQLRDSWGNICKSYSCRKRRPRRELSKRRQLVRRGNAINKE